MNPAFWHPFRYWRWRRRERRLAADWPRPGLPVAEASLLAVDLEMTGLNPDRDEIVSIGWVPIDAGVIDLAGSAERRVAARRGDGVGHSATIHGLRDCDLEDAASLEQALRALLSALSGRVAVFHHAPLDLAFLKRALLEHRLSRWNTPVIDTLAWHRRHLRLAGGDRHTQEKVTLEAACRHHGLLTRSQHDALADALSCAELLLALARGSRATVLEVAQLP